jgi:hypothetical protein
VANKGKMHHILVRQQKSYPFHQIGDVKDGQDLDSMHPLSGLVIIINRLGAGGSFHFLFLFRRKKKCF